MRAIRTFLALLLIMLLTGCSPPKQAPDFRQVTWGMNEKQIRAAEALNDDEIYIDPELIICDGVLFDDPAEIYYFLSNDQLASVRVNFVTSSRLLKDLMVRFDEITLELSAQYGDPLDADKHKWLDPDVAGELPDSMSPPGSSHPENDNVYLYYYVLIYQLEWQTERTRASLCLEVRNKNDISFHLELESLVNPE